MEDFHIESVWTGPRAGSSTRSGRRWCA